MYLTISTHGGVHNNNIQFHFVVLVVVVFSELCTMHKSQFPVVFVVVVFSEFCRF